MRIKAVGTSFLPEGTLEVLSEGQAVEVVHVPSEEYPEAMSIRADGVHIGHVRADDARGFVGLGWTRLAGEIESFTMYDGKRVGLFVNVARVSESAA